MEIKQQPVKPVEIKQQPVKPVEIKKQPVKPVEPVAPPKAKYVLMIERLVKGSDEDVKAD